MRLLNWSTTKTTPAESTVRPEGLLKLEAVPSPSVQATLPLPAKVVVTPVGVSILMRWLAVSAT